MWLSYVKINVCKAEVEKKIYLCTNFFLEEKPFILFYFRPKTRLLSSSFLAEQWKYSLSADWRRSAPNCFRNFLTLIFMRMETLWVYSWFIFDNSVLKRNKVFVISEYQNIICCRKYPCIEYKEMTTKYDIDGHFFFLFLAGFITVPGSAGGMLFGGYIVKKFDLKCRGIIRFSCACLFLCMCLGPSFLASCPSRPIAGVSTSYPANRLKQIRRNQKHGLL